jgi:hypothetical protein
MKINGLGYALASLACGLSLEGCYAVAAFKAPPALPAPPVAPPKTLPLNLQAANTTVTYDAASATTFVTNTGDRGAASAASGQGAKISLTSDAGGNFRVIAFNIPTAGGVVYTYQLPWAEAGDDTLSNPGLISLSSTGGGLWLGEGEDARLSQVAGTQGLSFSAYGYWSSNDTGPAAPAGTFAIGNLTPVASMPTTGTVTFNGSTVAVGNAIKTGATDSLVGNVQIVANFSHQSLTINLTGLQTVHFPAGSGGVITPLPDLTGSAVISGNAYAGPIAGGGLAGTLNGNFYGPAARETAGVWQASGGGNSWVGSFGAK